MPKNKKGKVFYFLTKIMGKTRILQLCLKNLRCLEILLFF